VLVAGLSTSAHADNKFNKYRAFYYDGNGMLLQVEDVPDRVLKDRNIVDIVDTTLQPIPLVTNKANAVAAGLNIPMKRLATLAVYYTYDGNKEPDENKELVQAKPYAVEDLRALEDKRVLEVCLARDPNEVCAFPKRCHCMTGTCCCY